MAYTQFVGNAIKMNGADTDGEAKNVSLFNMVRIHDYAHGYT